MWRAMLALLVVVMTGSAALADESRPCGGIIGAQCGAKQFCQYPIHSHCGQADMKGRCEARPEVCTMDYKPVCGCDGKTYSNRCMANAAGADVLKPGAC